MTTLTDVSYPLFDARLWILVDDPDSSTNCIRDQWHSLNMQAHSLGRGPVMDGILPRVWLPDTQSGIETIVLHGTVYDDGTFAVSHVELNGVMFRKDRTP